MNIFWKIVFSAVLVFSLYHLVRDVLQIFDVNNVFTNVGHRPHEWCSGFCDLVTLPFDVGGAVGAALVLKRQRIGWLGAAILTATPLLVVMSLLP